MSCSPIPPAGDMAMDTSTPQLSFHTCATSPSTTTAGGCNNLAASSIADSLLAHLAAVPAIAAVGKPNPKVYVPTSFRVGHRHVEVDALVDGGNTFASCINRDTFEKLPFTEEQLVRTATDSVNQAGGGARLKVLGKLPDKVTSDGFHIGSSRVRMA